MHKKPATRKITEPLKDLYNIYFHLSSGTIFRNP